MRVLLHHPEREVTVPGPRRVRELLRDLNVMPETVLVIRGDELVTEDVTIADSETVEIRPVISGGVR